MVVEHVVLRNKWCLVPCFLCDLSLLIEVTYWGLVQGWEFFLGGARVDDT